MQHQSGTRRDQPGALPHRQDGLPDRGAPDPQQAGGHARGCAARLQPRESGAHGVSPLGSAPGDCRGAGQAGHGTQFAGSQCAGVRASPRPEPKAKRSARRGWRRRRRGRGHRLVERARSLVDGDGACRRVHPQRRSAHPQEGLDRAQKPDPQYQLPDVHRRGRGRGARQVAGSGDGGVPVCRGRGDRGAVAGACQERDQGAHGHRAGNCRGQGWRGLGVQAGGRGGGRQPHPGAHRRAGAAGRTRRLRPRGAEPGADHRGKPARGQASG